MKTHKPTEVENIRAQHLVLQAIREEQRKNRSLPERLRKVIDTAKILSTVPSAGISEYTTRGKTEGSSPPAQQETPIKDHLARIEYAIEVAEAYMDSETTGGAATVFSMMSREEKDAELLKWRGVKSWVVAAKASWLGDSPRTIERARERLGVRSSNGLELDPEARRRWEERQAA